MNVSGQIRQKEKEGTVIVTVSMHNGLNGITGQKMCCSPGCAQKENKWNAYNKER